MMSMGDVVRYVPGMTAHQGENNRDQVVIRGNSSSADFFVNGVRDDVQYYRDLYNLDRVEALKGPNAMIFGRGGGGGVINRVTKEAGLHALAGVHRCRRRRVRQHARSAAISISRSATRSHPAERRVRTLRQLPRLRRPRTQRLQSDRDLSAGRPHDDHARLRASCTTRASPIAVSRRIRAARPMSPSARITAIPDDSHVRATVNLGTATIEHRFGGGWTLTQPHADRRLRSRLSELRSGCRDSRSVAGHDLCLQQRDQAAEPVQPDRPDLRRGDRRDPAHAARRRGVRPAAHRQLPEHGLFRQRRDVDSGAVRRIRSSRRRSPSGRARRMPTIT